MTWDQKFLAVARLTASWSKHPTTKVGCVIVDSDHNQLSGGYNGPPRGANDHLFGLGESWREAVDVQSLY